MGEGAGSSAGFCAGGALGASTAAGEDICVEEPCGGMEAGVGAGLPEETSQQRPGAAPARGTPGAGGGASAGPHPEQCIPAGMGLAQSPLMDAGASKASTSITTTDLVNSFIGKPPVNSLMLGLLRTSCCDVRHRQE